MTRSTPKDFNFKRIEIHFKKDVENGLICVRRSSGRYKNFFTNEIWRKFLPGIWNPNLKNSFHYNATPTPHITYKKLSPQSSNMMNLQENSTVVASNSPLSRVNPTTHWETDSEVWNWLRLIRGIIYFCVLTSSDQLSEALLRFTSNTATVFIDQTFETEAFFDEKALRTFVREKHYLPIQAGKNIFIIY